MDLQLVFTKLQLPPLMQSKENKYYEKSQVEWWYQPHIHLIYIQIVGIYWVLCTQREIHVPIKSHKTGIYIHDIFVRYGVLWLRHVVQGDRCGQGCPVFFPSSLVAWDICFVFCFDQVFFSLMPDFLSTDFRNFGTILGW